MKLLKKIPRGKTNRGLGLMAFLMLVFLLSSTSAYAVISTVIKGDLEEFNGATRYHTANLISQASYTTADTAILVDSGNFPDALAAGPLAYAYKAPILLTDCNKLSEETAKELARLKVKQVLIIGGTSAIGTNVEATLKKAGYLVERLQGAARYETALKVADKLQSKVGSIREVIFTVGDHYADALAIGSYASKKGLPILLTPRYAVPEDIMAYLKSNRISYVTIVGGELAIDQGVENQLRKAGIQVKRISGKSRVETATEVARTYFYNSNQAVVANGWTYVDALAATPFAARHNAPILLVDQNRMEPEVTYHLKYNEVDKAYVVGGELQVSKAIKAKVQDAINSERISIRVKNQNGSYSTQQVTGRFWNDYAKEAFDRQNQHRVNNGEKKLAWSNELNDPVQLRTAELEVSFSHTRPDGTRCFTAATTKPFHGENIAYGYETPQEVFEGFRDSPGHNQNMLNSAYKEGAFGCFVVNKKFYWTAIFAR